jgi:hypothetical protein
MKIATFNVNNINRRLPNLLQWLKSARPDIACLQELKSTDANFPIHAIEKAGYRAVWQGEKTWNGVAILSRDGEPIVTCRALPGDSDDWQSRYLEAAVNGTIMVASIFQTATPNRAPSLITNWRGSRDWRTMPSGSYPKAFPLFSPVTTTLLRLNRTSIKVIPGTMTLSCSLRVVLHTENC